jgi:hypothetical protein
VRAKFVFEKFDDESDPIEDMGIGTGNIDNLRYGNVLRAKHEYQIINTLDYENHELKRVWISGFGASLDFKSIDKNRYIIIMGAEYFDDNVKIYYFRPAGGLKGLKTELDYVHQHVSAEKRKQFADNYFTTKRKLIPKYFEFITFDF